MRFVIFIVKISIILQENDLKPEFKLKVAEWEVRKALAGHSNKVIIMIKLIMIEYDDDDVDDDNHLHSNKVIMIIRMVMVIMMIMMTLMMIIIYTATR